jgi:hypothetical protein
MALFPDKREFKTLSPHAGTLKRGGWLGFTMVKLTVPVATLAHCRHSAGSIVWNVSGFAAERTQYRGATSHWAEAFSAAW